MWILAQLLTEVTGNIRYKVVPGVDFQWSNDLWVNNMFRIYELVFWRRRGIRREATTSSDGKYICFTWEALFAKWEGKLRTFHLPQLQVTMPMLQTTAGLRIPASPYLFAIASGGTTSGIKNTGVAFTGPSVSGSNLIGVIAAGAGGAQTSITSTTWGGTATTLYSTGGAGAQLASVSYVIGANVTSAANIIMNFPGGGNFAGEATYYTGVDQATPVDDHQVNSGATANATVSLTTTQTGDWLTGCYNYSSGTPVAGAGTVIFGNLGMDSGNTVSVGSVSLNVTIATNTNMGAAALAIEPAAGAAGATRDGRLLTLLGLG